MYFLERFMSLRAFAILWGVFLIIDLFMQKINPGNMYTFQDGPLFSVTGQIMKLIAIFSFIYYLCSENR